MTNDHSPTGFQLIDNTAEYEYEMRHGSAIFEGLVKEIILRHIEGGEAIPEVLRPHALKWIIKGMGRKRSGAPSKRDRERALYFRMPSLLGADGKDLTMKEACKRIAKKLGGHWTTYRNAYRRICAAPTTFLLSADIPNLNSFMDPDDQLEEISRLADDNLRRWFGDEKKRGKK